MSVAVELPTVSRLGCEQEMESSPTPSARNVKAHIRTFPMVVNSLQVPQTSRLGPSVKPQSYQNTTTTNDVRDFQHVLRRQDTNITHLVGAGRFQSVLAKAQGSQLEVTGGLHRTVSCLPRRASCFTKSELSDVNSVKTAEETKKPKNTISLQFSSNKQYTYKDVIIQLYRIWEPQLSASYRPFVHYVPPVEDDDRESCVSEAVGSLQNEPIRSLKTAGTAIEAVNRFSKKLPLLNK